MDGGSERGGARIDLKVGSVGGHRPAPPRHRGSALRALPFVACPKTSARARGRRAAAGPNRGAQPGSRGPPWCRGSGPRRARSRGPGEPGSARRRARFDGAARMGAAAAPGRARTTGGPAKRRGDAVGQVEPAARGCRRRRGSGGAALGDGVEEGAGAAVVPPRIWKTASVSERSRARRRHRRALGEP